MMPPHVMKFFETIEEYDLYFIAYAKSKLGKEDRKILTSAGWRLQRHSRTQEEMWVYNKPEELAAYYKNLEESDTKNALLGHGR